MLIAQCTMQPDSRDGFRRQGDILVLMFPDHPWGTLDRKQFVRVEWNDSAVEKMLQARRDAGERFPVKSLPYLVGQIKQSDHAIDIAVLQDAGIIPVNRGGDSDIPVIPTGSVVLRTVTPTDTEPAGIWGTIKNAVVSAWNWMVG